MAEYRAIVRYRNGAYCRYRKITGKAGIERLVKRKIADASVIFFYDRYTGEYKAFASPEKGLVYV